MDIDSLFAGMAKADASGRGGNMGPGLYTVETKNILVKKGQNPKKPGDSFIVEFTILESNNEAHAIGSSGSWVQKTIWPSFFGNVTKFVYALLGNIDSEGWAATVENLKDEKKRTTAEQYARAMCGSDKAIKELGEEYEQGMFSKQKLKIEIVMEKTTSGGDFTAYKWSSAPETAAAVAA